MSPPAFSIVIPTYNYGQYLSRAVDSALAQEGADREVIVVDDGSTDQTAQVVKRYGDRLRYVHQSRQGPYAACAKGIALTEPGRYIIFLDADDCLQPGYVAAARAILDAQPETAALFARVVGVNKARGRSKLREAPLLDERPLVNFRNYIRGRLPVKAGGAIVARWALDKLWPKFSASRMCHGFDRVLVGHLLARHRCQRCADAVIEVHQHPGRLRDDVSSARRDGLDAVDYLFDPAILPAEAMVYRQLFHARLLLEQAGLLYHGKRYSEAQACYAQASRTHARAWLRPRHMRRHLISTARALTSRHDVHGNLESQT